MNTIQKGPVALLAIGILSFATAGCDRQVSAEQTQAAVVDAQVKGAEKIAKAARDANESTMDAQQKADKANERLTRESAEATRKVRIVQADADYQVAIEKCGAFSGDQRSVCKKQAEADVATAKSDAKSEERAVNPNP
ncbi:hypothetical protein SAMN04488038_103242 [Solimonas aquatica]|uniref:DUF4398 domain-containing protein n=1 Tax=Solimonas aquatica TaxID=489703 RepID=A0A1H9CZE2_9GAMM|nr:hypothetical protein [Solimonas aquatica]SEQ06497.1 hypothetical protein SAMN04488038_103242 [Solimonas aquatica]